MKRIFPILASLMLIAVFATSCKDVKPDFKFDLNLTGEVSNAPTNIAGNFDVAVCNAPAKFFAVDNATVLSCDENKNASDFIDDYIEKNVIAYFNDAPNTIYDFTVKGYISESVTGIKFSVDRRFTNKPEN